jgi:serine phosphatase RsbU (regulator of sigma subunit)
VRDSSEVFIAVCGHPRPIKFQSTMNDHPILVGSSATILGITADLQVKMNVITLDAGDSLVLYTDGVEFPRVLAKILPFYKRYKHVDANTAAKFLVSDVKERKKNFEDIQADDVSLVWFRKLKSKSIKAS